MPELRSKIGWGRRGEEWVREWRRGGGTATFYFLKAKSEGAVICVSTLSPRVSGGTQRRTRGHNQKCSTAAQLSVRDG